MVEYCCGDYYRSSWDNPMATLFFPSPEPNNRNSRRQFSRFWLTVGVVSGLGLVTYMLYVSYKNESSASNVYDILTEYFNKINVGYVFTPNSCWGTY
uniref:Uncharacterized protein n=1 Tax=Strigamia maritima TaxID=126957 RepID=T1IZG2_STRMM